jgi:hypothetical protein
MNSLLEKTTSHFPAKVSLRKSSLGDHKLHKLVLPTAKEGTFYSSQFVIHWIGGDTVESLGLSMPSVPAPVTPIEEKIKFTIFLPDGQKKRYWRFR